MPKDSEDANEEIQQLAALSPREERNNKKRAEKEAKKAGKNGKKGGGKGVVIALFIIIPIILIGLLAAITFLNPLNLRDGALAPYLLRVPFVQNFVVQEYDYYAVEELTPGQLQAEVIRLTSEKEALEAEVERLTSIDSAQLAEINQMRGQLLTQQTLENNRALFENDAADASPAEFRSWFAEFDPVRAEGIYERLTRADIRNTEYRQFFNNILSMEESSAASALEEMIPVHTQVVLAVLRGLNSQFVGEILNQMSPENAALIIRQLYPGEIYNQQPDTATQE